MKNLYPLKTPVKISVFTYLLTLHGSPTTVLNISSKVYRIINLFRRTFNPNIPTSSKRKLYIALILPQLLYCSPVWRPNLIKDILFLEKIQRRATKYILNNYTINYKERLISLSLLPLMYQFELNDILLFISCLKNPNHNFTLMDHLTFNSSSTRSSTFYKLNQNSTNQAHSYVCRLPRLWNSLPVIDTSQSYLQLKKSLKIHFWSHFMSNFNPNNSCSYHSLYSLHQILIL